MTRMRPSGLSASSRTACAVMLTVAMLFAQWLGVQHRIAHAFLPSIAAPSGGEHGAGHSCAMFDAATMADALHLPPGAAPLPGGAGVLAGPAAFVSWDAPAAVCFSSRAPPFA